MLQNKLRYVVLVIAMGLLSILYNQYVMGIIFLTIIIMPFCLFALLSFTFGMVRAELVSAVHVANKGEAIPITVLLHNPTIFPVSNITIYLKYKNAYSARQYKKEFNVSLDRRTSTTVICNIQSEFAGNLEISLAGIRLYDYMKLFSLKKKLKWDIKIAVLPYFYEAIENNILTKSNQMVESDYYSTVKSGDDPSEVFAIREYAEGDRPQRIHWKLSMKQDQLMIKDFSDPLNCSILIFVDLQVPKGESALYYMDALLECAVSLSNTLIVQKQIHYFSWYDDKHGACRRLRIEQEKDLFEAVDGLLQASIHSEKTDPLSAYLAEHPNDQYTDVFYVTGKLSEEKFYSISLLRSNSKQLLHLNDVYHNMDSEDEDQYKVQISFENYRKSAEEMGIGLLPMNIRNIKGDIEQLRLS